MMTTSEIIIQRLAQHGIHSAFGVVGGSIMYITDALRKCHKISTIFTHHEQSAVVAAEAYGKLSNQPAIAFAAAGPGVTNAVTGLADAFMDSVPLIFLVGDVRTSIAADFTQQRCNSPQEVDQKSILKSIVKKYLVLYSGLTGPDLVALIDEMVSLSLSGRKGPVCISVPLDIQSVVLDDDCLGLPLANQIGITRKISFVDMATIVDAFKRSKAPVILLGAGIRQSGAVATVRTLIKKLKVPYCVTIGAADLQDNNDELSVGCVGPTSQRAANLILQASDFILAVGTSLDQSITGFNIDKFFIDKLVVLVNVDGGEFLRFDSENLITINTDAKDFTEELLQQPLLATESASWLQKIGRIKLLISSKIEQELRSPVRENYLCAYKISHKVSMSLQYNAIIVLGISLDAASVFNSFAVTHGQRIIVSRNLGPMGWDLPAAIGATVMAKQKEPVVLITGDGSIMLNIQELAIISALSLPICIFIFNNAGYTSIRTTQSNFFQSNFFGSSADSGLNLPDFSKLAVAFDIEYIKLLSLEDISGIINSHTLNPRPIIVECMVDPEQLREPRLVSRVENGVFYTPSLDDMSPQVPENIKQKINSILS